MISIIPYSPKAILVQWDGPIKLKTVQEVNTFNQLLLAKKIPNIQETIPAYNSLLVCYKGIRFSEIKSILEKIEAHLLSHNIKLKNRTWKLPLLPSPKIPHELSSYINIEKQGNRLSFWEIEFTIGMKGFLPGFVYLAGLPQAMHLPRRSIPTQNVAKGSVAIGGSQCGIYPIDSPGGWHIIGNCPIPLIDIKDARLSCFNVGDSIRFISIDKSQHLAYENNVWNLDKIITQFSGS